MKGNPEIKRQSGFTLIEIAIVMVIIGLLIGGVLKGQALIENAKIKSVIHDMDGVQAAWYGYVDRKKEYPTAQADYTVANGTSDFWFQTRTDGLIRGQASSIVPGVNAMGGYIGIINSLAVTGISGPAVCTSVQSKYAQGIDAALDDGISTNGDVKGIQPVTGALNEVLAGTAPMTGFYTSAGYVILCRQL